MKIKKTLQFTIVAAVAFALPARADTMSVPTAANPSFSLDVPASWKPKADTSDESVDATAPGNSAYLSAWLSKSSESAEASTKDLDATLKDSMKTIDEGVKSETVKANGLDLIVVKGSGTDKRAGTKVLFQVAFFDTAGGHTGIVYIDYDKDAPKDIMDAIQGIMKSIRPAGKK